MGESIVGKRMTQEEYRTKVEEWNIKNYGKKDVFTVEDKFITTGIKVRVKHNVEGCGVVREVSPDMYSRGHTCLTCDRREFEKRYDKIREELETYFKREYGNGEEYTIEGELRSLTWEVKFKHNVKGCGHEFKTQPKTMLEGKRCSKCYNIRRGTVAHNRKSEEDFLREVKESNVKLGLKEDDYIFLEKYRGRHTKIRVKHTDGKCNREYEVRPGDFFRGNRCAKCEGNMKRTQEQFEKEVGELNYHRSGDKEEYLFYGDYVSSVTEMGVKHQKCGHKYKVLPYVFIHMKSGCPKCYGTPKKTTEQFKKEVREMLGEDYEVIGQYVTNGTPISIRHNSEECGGYEYSVAPNTILSGRGSKCKKCYGMEKFTKEWVDTQVKGLVGDEYEFTGEYEGVSVKMGIKHNLCGHSFQTSPAAFIRGSSRCPRCQQSAGEMEVERELKRLGELYIYQHNLVKNPETGRWLRSDYAIIGNDGGVIGIVEFDGKQHYEPIDFFGGEDTFKRGKERDEIKDNYCEENNIPYVRIAYWEFDRVGELVEDFVEKIKTGLNN